MRPIRSRPPLQSALGVSPSDAANWRADANRFGSVTEAGEPGASVASVARRHSLNANLIFNWRRRFGVLSETALVPAVIMPEDPLANTSPPVPADHLAPAFSPADGERMEMVCAGGCRLIVGPDFDALAVVRLLAVLEDR